MKECAIGSPEHKELFCRWFIDTHRVYEATDLHWPDLDAAALARLRAVPIWNDAIQVETKAGELVTGFAETIEDPLIREAVAVQGVEETRHGQILATMIRRYGLNATEDRLPVTISERTFVDFAYKECMDAFIGFGAFRIARDTHFLPEDFLTTFTGFMGEETRHIVFFVNWIAYERIRRGRGNPAVQAILTAFGYARALRLLMGSVNSARDGSGFMGGGDAFANLTLGGVLATCLRENALQLAPLDPRLLRPRMIPAVARIILGAVQTGERLSTLTRGLRARPARD
jgi:hypothetical protein